jgi:hypothetical protein
VIVALAGLALASPEMDLSVELPLGRTVQLDWGSWIEQPVEPRKLGLGGSAHVRLYGAVVLGAAVRTMQRAWDTELPMQSHVTQGDLMVNLRTPGVVQFGGGFGAQIARYDARGLDGVTTLAPLFQLDLSVPLIPKGPVRPLVSLHTAMATRTDEYSVTLVDPTLSYTARYLPGSLFAGVRLGVQWGGGDPPVEAVVVEPEAVVEGAGLLGAPRAGATPSTARRSLMWYDADGLPHRAEGHGPRLLPLQCAVEGRPGRGCV